MHGACHQHGVSPFRFNSLLGGPDEQWDVFRNLDWRLTSWTSESLRFRPATIHFGAGLPSRSLVSER